MKKKTNLSKMIDASDNFQPVSKQVSEQNNVLESVKNWLKRFGANIKEIFDKTEYGHTIILIGHKKSGKSETVKTLCKQISGDKYIVRFNEGLIPDKIPKDDKKDWEKIKGVKIIENETQMMDATGLMILEDFPNMDEDKKRIISNKIKMSRHDGYKANYILIVHDYDDIKGPLFNLANSILIYKDAPIKAQHLGPKVGDLSKGWAIYNAKNDIQQFQYIFVSFDHKKWHNPIYIDSRNVNILKKAIRGKLKTSELSIIDYPKKNHTSAKAKKDTEKELIEELIRLGFTNDEIMSCVNLSHPGYIWKIKHYLKKEFTNKYGKQNLPNYLEDGRK